jgi:uncharacterized protein YjbI with pentapeptide repeats
MVEPTTKLKTHIAQCIKNQIDISDLIENVNIQNLDLSYAKISRFNRINDNISGCSLAKATIGQETTTTHLSGTVMVGCNFKDTRFLGKVMMKHVDARNTNFDGTWLPRVSYRGSDFRGATFCQIAFTIGGLAGHGAKFNKSLLDRWGLEFYTDTGDKL